MRGNIHSAGRRSGQIVVALAIMLLALTVLALMNLDTFLALRGKTRAVNAGDAAALAAAHWQGITLNLVGELNLARLNAIYQNVEDPETANEVSAGIFALQERIAFAGPVMARYAASKAAAANHSGPNRGMTQIVDTSIDLAMKVEPEGSESWPTRWKDYAQMLKETRCSSCGCLHATCSNAHLFDLFSNFYDGHILHSRPFYEAVAGRDWCWFFLRKNMYSLLRNFTSWPPLGDPLEADCDNPEYFGVGLCRGYIDTAILDDIILDFAAKYELPDITEESIKKMGDERINEAPWYQYDGSVWRTWTEMDPYGHDILPLVSAPKDEYNLLGATAAASANGKFPLFTPRNLGRVSGLKNLDANALESEEERKDNIRAERHDWMSAMVESSRNVAWEAAAKPFGCRETGAGSEQVTRFNGLPFPLVTPDFTTVRLIPLAGASGGCMGDAEWVVHLRDHLQDYMSSKSGKPGCKWCSALAKWDKPEFRQAGVEWLKENSEKCLTHGGNGPCWPKGGTRHAH